MFGMSRKLFLGVSLVALALRGGCEASSNFMLKFYVLSTHNGQQFGIEPVQMYRRLLFMESNINRTFELCVYFMTINTATQGVLLNN